MVALQGCLNTLTDARFLSASQDESSAHAQQAGLRSLGEGGHPTGLSRLHPYPTWPVAGAALPKCVRSASSMTGGMSPSSKNDSFPPMPKVSVRTRDLFG